MASHKSLSNYFKGSDIDLAFTRWLIEGSNQYRIYPPLADDREQYAFIGVKEKMSVIFFRVFEKDGQLIYSDLNYLIDYIVDLTDFKRIKLTSTVDAAEVYLIRQAFEDLDYR